MCKEMALFLQKCKIKIEYNKKESMIARSMMLFFVLTCLKEVAISRCGGRCN